MTSAEREADSQPNQNLGDKTIPGKSFGVKMRDGIEMEESPVVIKRSSRDVRAESSGSIDRPIVSKKAPRALTSSLARQRANTIHADYEIKSVQSPSDAQSLQDGGLLVKFRHELAPWIKKGKQQADSLFLTSPLTSLRLSFVHRSICYGVGQPRSRDL